MRALARRRSRLHLTPGFGLAEEMMHSSELETPLLAHQSGPAVQMDCRSHVNLIPPQELAVPAGWRLIGSSHESA